MRTLSWVMPPFHFFKIYICHTYCHGPVLDRLAQYGYMCFVCVFSLASLSLPGQSSLQAPPLPLAPATDHSSLKLHFFLNAVLVLCQMQWDADLDSLKTALNWDTWGLQFCRCCFLWSYLTSRMGSRCTLWVILVGKSILSNHCSNFSPVRKLCTVYGKDQLWIPLQIRWLKRWFLR